MSANHHNQPPPPTTPDEPATASDLLADDSAATTLEYALLLAAIAIPSYWISTLALNLLVEHYRMMTLINSLPFP